MKVVVGGVSVEVEELVDIGRCVVVDGSAVVVVVDVGSLVDVDGIVEVGEMVSVT